MRRPLARWRPLAPRRPLARWRPLARGALSPAGALSPDGALSPRGPSRPVVPSGPAVPSRPVVPSRPARARRRARSPRIGGRALAAAITGLRPCPPCGGSVRTRGLRTGWREFSRISESPSIWAATGRLPQTTARPPDPDRRGAPTLPPVAARPGSGGAPIREWLGSAAAFAARPCAGGRVCRLRASTPRHRRQHPPDLSSARLPHHRRRLTRSGIASPPAEVPRPPSKPELPRRSPPPDSKLAESQRRPPGGSPGTASSGVITAPPARPPSPASPSGPALARPVPGVEDRPLALPAPPATPSGPVIAAPAPAPAPPSGPAIAAPAPAPPASGPVIAAPAPAPATGPAIAAPATAIGTGRGGAGPGIATRSRAARGGVEGSSLTSPPAHAQPPGGTGVAIPVPG